MPIVKKKSDNDYLSGHWKGVKFDIFVVKDKKYSIIMMSTNSGLMVCENKKMNNKYQKEIYTNSSIHNPFIVTNFIEEMWTITMLCTLTE